MLFQDVVAEGYRADVRVADGRIVALARREARYAVPGDPGAAWPESALTALPGEEVVRGGMLTPPLAEPHVHLDAVLLGEAEPNRSGTLVEGIRNWAKLRPGLTAEDAAMRARRVLGWYAAWGTLRVRTHVDTEGPVAVDALLGLRGQVRQDAGLGWMDLQVVAFPQEGILRAPGRRGRWEAAVAAGCDAVGVIPHFERTDAEGAESVRLAFALAERHGLRVDLHCDETDDPQSRHLGTACAETLDRGFQGRVVAGHCTAMHSYENPYAAKVIALVVESGVQVVVNPLDNVVLQGRYDHYPKRRGLARVDQLWEAGASVGIGHDSVVDPWYRLGTANLVDAAWMAVHLGHLTSEDQLRRAFRALHHDNHRPWGEPPRLEVGAEATLLRWPVTDPIEALRLRPRPQVYARGVRLDLPEPGLLG